MKLFILNATTSRPGVLQNKVADISIICGNSFRFFAYIIDENGVVS